MKKLPEEEEKIFRKRGKGRSCFHLYSDGNTANETFIHLTYNLKVFKKLITFISFVKVCKGEIGRYFKDLVLRQGLSFDWCCPKCMELVLCPIRSVVVV